MSRSQPVRSSIYKRMYPDELMMEAFGTLTPDTTARTAYFFDLWMKRRQYRHMLGAMSAVDSATELLNTIGLRNPWDYQIRGFEIRFEYPEDLAQFKITWGK